MSTTPINFAPADSFEPAAVETIGDYLVPHDPMDDLGCDSCQ
jgi:hypothetical protein